MLGKKEDSISHETEKIDAVSTIVIRVMMFITRLLQLFACGAFQLLSAIPKNQAYRSLLWCSRLQSVASG